MRRLLSLLRPRHPMEVIALLGLVFVFVLQSCKDPGTDSYLEKPGKPGAVTFAIPTPEPIEVFWIDSAGNLGLRGVTAVVPGLPDAGSNINDACRKSAVENGRGTLTVCMEPVVGKTLAEKLGLDTWTSETSEKR